MRIGIFSKTFPGTDPSSVLASVASAGFSAAQFNLACAGLASMPDQVPDPAIAAIREAAVERGVALVALSGTYNMIHPDPAVRADGLSRLRVVLAAARALKIPLVTLCTGTRDAQDQWRHHKDNAAPQAWADLCREMAAALDFAEADGVDLGIEPEQANVVTGSADARRLIDEMASKRLRVVLDPANLFERATRAEASGVVADAVESLADWIAMAHAKDRAEDGSFVTAGAGVVDFRDFLARLHAAGFDGPVVTHGLSPAEAPGVAAFLKTVLPT